MTKHEFRPPYLFELQQYKNRAYLLCRDKHDLNHTSYINDRSQKLINYGLSNYI